jgi:SAM-dependent methyltransferase
VNCNSCGAQTLLVLDLGDHALAGAFLHKEEIAAEKKYPLRLHFCNYCYLVQIERIVPPEQMFRKYFYHSSAIETLREHFTRYAADVTARFQPRSVLEIGCNDGVMLRPLAAHVPRVIGVDPAQLTQWIDHPGIVVINEFWSEEIAEQIGQVDMVIANNVFAHIADLHGAVRAIKRVLAPGGVFIFEVNHLGAMLSELAYDWIYHEHLYYWSLIALRHLFAPHGMTVFDVEPIPNHAGSMRYFVAKDGRMASQHVLQLADREVEDRLNRFKTFQSFAESVENHRNVLRIALGSLAHQGRTVAGYGACGRANTMIQYCDINTLGYIVDDAPAKWGFLTPGSHVPIYPSSWLDIQPVDYVIVFAWSFLPEIQRKTHGKSLLIPLPKIHILREQVAA